ncbi:hypothetical protein WIW50_12485 [Flavobacteriaceae bacterium 3-367]
MKHIPAILFLLLLSTSGIAQQENRSYRKAKLYLKDFRILKAKALEIGPGEVNFFNVATRANEKVELDDLTLIRVPRGSHALAGGLYGAGTMALTAFLIDVQPDPLGIERERGAEFYIGFTAGGALLGALVGSLFPKWKPLFSDGKFVGRKLPLQWGVTTQYNGINLKIKLAI